MVFGFGVAVIVLTTWNLRGVPTVHIHPQTAPVNDHDFNYVFVFCACVVCIKWDLKHNCKQQGMGWLKQINFLYVFLYFLLKVSCGGVFKGVWSDFACQPRWGSRHVRKTRGSCSVAGALLFCPLMWWIGSPGCEKREWCIEINGSLFKRYWKL